MFNTHFLKKNKNKNEGNQIYFDTQMFKCLLFNKKELMFNMFLYENYLTAMFMLCVQFFNVTRFFFLSTLTCFTLYILFFRMCCFLLDDFTGLGNCMNGTIFF